MLCLSIFVINYYEFCLLWKNALKSKTRNFTDDDKYMNYVTGVWLMQSTSTGTCTSISLPNSYNLDYQVYPNFKWHNTKIIKPHDIKINTCITLIRID